LDEVYYTKSDCPSQKWTKTLRNPHNLLTNSLTTFQKKNLTEIYKEKIKKLRKNGKKWQKIAKNSKKWQKIAKK
tara:strand:+ start:161 stop:382 length:222 start_codon:yes stop_codon:yes gene_type:complete